MTSPTTNIPPLNVLVTGGNGYIGRKVLRRLVQDEQSFKHIVSFDVRETSADRRMDRVKYVVGDIRDADLAEIITTYKIDTVVHLAAIVTPGKNSDREFEHSVDVIGTRRLLEAAASRRVRQIIVTSSGAAYGYYADNPEWLDEDDDLRGNVTFAYSDHKRQVEEMLVEYRETNPYLKQLIFRPGTVLGAGVRNQITALFDKPIITGLRQSDTPFVLIWDEDVANCIVKGIVEQREGIYNLAGDGTLSLKEIAGLLKKPFLALPVSLVRAALSLLKPLGLSQYGPEQVDFIRYRPVLSNRRLKEEFGYEPQKTTREVFEYFLQSRKTNR